jgi:cAMP-dependent protein kinase regulator
MSLKGRTSVCAEVYGIFNKQEDFKPRVIPKSQGQKDTIKSCVHENFLFSNLEDRDLETVIDAMEERVFNANASVITEGENGDCLYLIQSGNLDCYKEIEGEKKHIKVYLPGESFGELALLYNAPRAATIIASSDCILWALDRETFNHIVKDAAMKKRERYQGFLNSVEILSGMDAYEISQISDALKIVKVKEGEFIIRQGEMGDKFYIVEDGEAYATKIINESEEPLQVKEYHVGGYFGELALLKNECRNANVIAKVI